MCVLVQLTERESISSECQVTGQPGREGFFTHSRQLCLIIQPFPNPSNPLCHRWPPPPPWPPHRERLRGCNNKHSLIIITAVQHLHVSSLAHTHTHTNPSAYNGPSCAQTAPRNRAFCKQIIEPTSVFHVFLNPEISVVDLADLHTGFPENWKAAQCEYILRIFPGNLKVCRRQTHLIRLECLPLQLFL